MLVVSTVLSVARAIFLMVNLSQWHRYPVHSAFMPSGQSDGKDASVPAPTKITRLCQRDARRRIYRHTTDGQTYSADNYDPRASNWWSATLN